MIKTRVLAIAAAAIVVPALIGARHGASRTDGVAAVPLTAAHAPRSVWDSVYTAEQAKRGEGIYRQYCVRCHKENLAGDADSAPLTGSTFMGNWNNTSVSDLHEKIFTMMPSDSLGVLNRQQVADVIAYIFSFDGFPAGKAELLPAPEFLKQIRIEASKSGGGDGAANHVPWPPVATFSILAFDAATGEIGGAVQSRVFSVGNGVLWAEAGVGAAATQAIVDVGYGPRAIELLRKGTAPAAVVRQIWEADPDPRPQDWSKEGRQFAVIDASGNVAAYTGPKATTWAGHKSCASPKSFCTAQGNILAGPDVVDSMVAAFERTDGHLSLRLLAALEGGQLAGGDKRGMQSAAMLIVKKDGGVWLHNDTVLRLQVDDNPEPIKELRRLVEKAAAQRRR
jgi:uncharacterized Ntn-hydrolase superfamily protein/mono/diheme cytochrome c family protein